MTYEEATEARVTPRQALCELRKHDIDAYITGRAIIAQGIDAIGPNGELIPDVAEFAIGPDGMVSGRVILDWLGY